MENTHIPRHINGISFSIPTGAEPPWGLGGARPPKPQGSPQKKKKKLKKNKIKILPQIFLFYFFILAPQNFFFFFNLAPQLWGAGSAPAYLAKISNQQYQQPTTISKHSK
jgi:hypothetical protein